MSDTVQPPSKRSSYTVSIIVALLVLAVVCLATLPGQISEIAHRLAQLPPPPPSGDLTHSMAASEQRGEIEGYATAPNLIKALVVYGALMLWLVAIKKRKVRRPILMALLFIVVGSAFGCVAGPMAESRVAASRAAAPTSAVAPAKP